MKFDWYTKKNSIFQSIFIVAVVCFWLTVFLSVYLLNYRRNIVANTKKETQEQAHVTAQELDKQFANVIRIAENIADGISKGKIKKENISETLKKYVITKNKLFGMGVSFIPNMNDNDIRTVSPYYVSRTPVNLTDKGELLKVYSAPIYSIDSVTKKRIVTGAVFVDFLVNDIKDVMRTLYDTEDKKSSLGKSGYGFLLSQNGKFIAHPVSEYNMNEANLHPKTIFEIAAERDDKQFAKLGENTVIRGLSGILEHKNDVTGQDSWLFYEPIHSINWSLVVVFVIEEIPIKPSITRNLEVGASVSLLVFLLALTALITRADTGNEKRMIWCSTIISVLLFFEILFIWRITMVYDTADARNAQKIVDKTGLDNIKNQYARRVQTLCKTVPFFVPTGVYLVSMDFPTANNVILSGYVWQKYDKMSRDSIKPEDRGITFPEAVKDVFAKTFSKEEKDFTVYGWYFQVTIKQSFDFSKYPLDKKNLMLRIVPKNFEQNIVLTPDLDGYKFINPTMKPGVDKELTVSSWDIIESNFVYKYNYYNTNFGLERFECKYNSPELVFDVKMSRNFVGTIIATLLPLLVMQSILFLLIIVSTRNIDMVGRMTGPIGSCFFTVLLAHVSVRRDLVIEGIVYFEYFYIVMYFMILFVFFNTIMYSQEVTRFFFHYKKNLITKLTFWPAFFFLLVIISLYLLVIKA